MKSILRSLAIGGALLSLSISSFANTHQFAATHSESPKVYKADHYSGPNGNKLPDKFTQQMNLSQQQQVKLKGVMEKHKPQMQALQKQMGENRKKLRQLKGHASAQSQEAIKKITHAQRELLKKAIILRQQIKSEVYGILTPEQHQQMENLRRTFHKNPTH